MVDKVYKYADIRDIVGDGIGVDRWVLVPYPIESLKSKPAEFERAVNGARVQLVHVHWETVGEAVRELSDTGGIDFVNVMRVKRSIAVNSTFVDGKKDSLRLDMVPWSQQGGK
jgi:hypothetical protein